MAQILQLILAVDLVGLHKEKHCSENPLCEALDVCKGVCGHVCSARENDFPGKPDKSQTVSGQKLFLIP